MPSPPSQSSDSSTSSDSSNPSIPTPPRSSDRQGSDPSLPGAEQSADASNPSLPGQEGAEGGQAGDRNQDGAIIPTPGQPDGQGVPTDTGGGPPGGDPSDPRSGGLPGLPGEQDGWESSNEDPGDGRPAGGTPRSGTEGEDEDARRTPGGRPGAQGEFDEAIGVLDGQILAERADVYARRNETAGQTAPLPGDGATEREQSEQAGGTPGPPSPGVMPEGGRRQPGRPAPRAIPAPAAPVPPDVADARDDDVVCRQLREAAMVETDDALREALWDEYRRCRDG